MCCMVLLAACGKKEETTTPQESANVGDVLSNKDMGVESADCPGIYEPVCSDTKVTYKNACHADKAGEKAWQPGEC